MYSIKVNTPSMANVFVFESMSTSESLSRPPSYQITLLSQQAFIDPDKILAQPIVIIAELDGQDKRVVFAYVTEFSSGSSDGTYNWHRYHATAHTWLWFLGQNSDCRAFQKKTVIEIFREILKESQYAHFAIKDNTNNLRLWQYSVQYRETDLNFISRLLEQEGIYFYFEHQEQGATLILENNSTVTHKKLKQTLHYVFNTEDKEDRFTVSSLGFVKKLQSTKYVLADYNALDKAVVLSADYHLGNDNIKTGNSEIYDYPGEFETDDDARDYVKIRAEELAVSGSSYAMSCNNTALAAGMMVSVKSPMWQNAIKQFFVTEIALNFRQNARETGSGGETGFSASFKAIPASKSFRPARITPLPIAQGLQTAIVTGAQGSEIYTNSDLQVRVKFHWDRHGKNDEQSSCWLRVSQILAGKKRGFLAVPRVGDEVIIAFENGDPDRPMVIGSVYNAINKGRHGIVTEETKTGLVTLSSKQGGESYNEFSFDDKKGEELVFVRAQKNLHFLVNNDVKTLVNHNVAEKIKNDFITDIGNDYTLQVANNTTTKVGNNLTLDVGAAEQVKVGTDFTLKAGQNITIQAGTKITLKAGASTIELGPEGITIKGSIVKIN